MPKTSADLIIEPTWLLPVTPRNVLRSHAVAIADGVIVGVGSRTAIDATYDARSRLRLDGQALLPGLVNAHGHAAMVLFRGLAEDMSLDTWLRQRIWPLEARWISPDFVADGVALALAEMIRSGTTCFADMYFFPEQSARAARLAGMRAQVAFPLIDFPNAWSKHAAEAFEKGLSLHDEYRDDALIRIAFGPHSAYALARNELHKTLVLAEEIDAPIHIHLHETAAEVAAARREHGCSHVEYLERLGMLSPRLQAVHLTQLDDADLERLAASGVCAVHCPQSNLKLGSGTADVLRMRRHGIPVGLGSDGAAANNSLDMFAEARSATLLAKTLAHDPTAMEAHDALELATLGSARALGIDATVGSIEVGKSADLIAVDLTHPSAIPVHRPEAALLHTAAGSHVRHAWIAGRAVLDEGRLTSLDERDVLARANRWVERLAS
jgi:5-methylthioadenosine/S-adenosylhomocysteine deaminase